MTPSPARSIPDDLVNDILAGNCVAFVGAGFSAPADVPTWAGLLASLAKSIDQSTAVQIERLLQNHRLVNFEAAAQIMRDKIGGELYQNRLRELVRPRASAVAGRKRALLGIPFRAILTTNFDGLLEGRLPGPDAYREILRPRDHRWWDERFWRAGDDSGPPVVCLHGDLAHSPDSTVLTTRDYRDRLRSDTSYSTFLRAVFATNSVLFLGFSFSDYYLNELRAQILSLFQPRPDEPGFGQQRVVTAYALIDDVDDPDVLKYFRHHEGIEVFSYDTKLDGHQPFDEFLTALYDRTNPQLVLGARLLRKRILWVDPHPEDNPEGVTYFSDAVDAAQGELDMLVCPSSTLPASEKAIVKTVLATLERAQRAGRPFDLMISHWGHGAEVDDDGAACPRGLALLDGLHQRRIRVPVVFFASPDFADDNKRVALAAGAAAFTWSWAALCRTVAEIFA